MGTRIAITLRDTSTVSLIMENLPSGGSDEDTIQIKKSPVLNVIRLKNREFITTPSNNSIIFICMPRSPPIVRA